MKSFVVELWSKIFSVLEKISPFWVIRWAIRKKFSASSKIYHFVESYYGFVELWVLGNLMLSIVLLSICSAANLQWWEAIAVGWGAIRVWEVIIYQINVLLFAEYRAKKEESRLKQLREPYVPYAFRGFRRIVILLLHNYAEIIFWFALFYRNLDWAFETGKACLNSFFTALNFSFVKMTTFGYTTIYPKEPWGDVLVFTQSAIGLFMALLILARFISFLPKPKTLDEFER